MDIFIGYTKESSFEELQKTLEAWDKIDYAEPAAIECPKAKFEVYRRVTAEHLSGGDYILCDLGYVPTYPDIVLYAEKLLRENRKVGMFNMKGGVFICRKGIVDKWLVKKSAFYIPEHARAYHLKGYDVAPCPQVYCQRLSVS